MPLRSMSDRFIPTRANMNIEISHHKIRHRDSTASIEMPEILDFDDHEFVYFNYHKQKFFLTNYVRELNEIMFSSQRRVLSFSKPTINEREQKVRLCSDLHNGWPVHARDRPLMQKPVQILDMPNINPRLDYHILDWGKKGYIATIHKNEVHLWHPDRIRQREITTTGKQVGKCVKWNQDGTLFAISITNPTVVVWNTELKLQMGLNCVCKFCYVHSITWDIENHIVIGCNNGQIGIYNMDANFINGVRGHARTIITLQFSCNEKFLVTSSLDCNVKIWEYPVLTPLLNIEFDKPIRAISWHPWRESYLAIAGLKFIKLYSVNSFETIAMRKHPFKYCFVDQMTFNPLTAELVVSYFEVKDDSTGIHYLTVLKNMDAEVERIRFHNDRVPYLIWDSSYTKLGTASADENLCIWEFFGSSEEAKKYIRKNSRKLTSDPVKTQFMMGNYIR